MRTTSKIKVTVAAAAVALLLAGCGSAAASHSGACTGACAGGSGSGTWKGTAQDPTGSAARILSADGYPLYHEFTWADISGGQHQGSGWAVADEASGATADNRVELAVVTGPGQAAALAAAMQPYAAQLNGQLDNSSGQMLVAVAVSGNVVRVTGNDDGLYMFLSLWGPNPTGLLPPPPGSRVPVPPQGTLNEGG
jgi:hypothetical protein